MSLDGDHVVVIIDEGRSEFRPISLNWKDSRQFRVSGLDRRLRQRQNTLRFRTGIEAKQAASAIMDLGRVAEQEASQPREEIPVEIPARVLLGPLFLGFVGLELFIVITVFVSSTIFRWISSFAFIILFYAIFSKILDRQLSAGPATAWFRPRTLKAWLSMDERDIVIRTIDKKESYRPSKIDWIDSRSFRVIEEGTTFQLVFQGPDDAMRIASMIKGNLASADEGISGATC
jgi:hypothetical protein